MFTNNTMWITKRIKRVLNRKKKASERQGSDELERVQSKYCIVAYVEIRK